MRAFPHSKAHPARFRATPQLTRLALSDASIRRKRHKSATSSVMGSGGLSYEFPYAASSVASSRVGAGASPPHSAPAPTRLAMTIQNNYPLKAVAGATVSFLPLLSCVFLPGGKFLSDGRRISTSASLLIPRLSFIFMTLPMALL